MHPSRAVGEQTATAAPGGTCTASRPTRTARCPSGCYTAEALSIFCLPMLRSCMGVHSQIKYVIQHCINRRKHKVRLRSIHTQAKHAAGKQRCQDAPLDIILKLPSSALNSMSCATIPEACMFCTASSAVLSGTLTCASPPHPRRTGEKVSSGAQLEHERNRWTEILIMEDVSAKPEPMSTSLSLAPRRRREEKKTHDVRRRFDSDALRSFT